MHSKARHVDPLQRNPPPPPEDPDYSDEEEEFDLVEVMNAMTPAERRKVYALHGLLEEYKALRTKHMAAIAQLQMDNHKALESVFHQRREIVTGVRDITAEEIAKIPPTASSSSAEAAAAAEDEKKKSVTVVAPNDEAVAAVLAKAADDPAGGIPNFWLTAMSNSEALDSMITERDRPALSALQDIVCSYIDEDPRKGVTITFRFDKNPYFTDAELTKTYHMEYNEDDGDVEVADIVGCDIHWTDPKHNLTVVIKEKKQRNKKNNQIRVVQREEKCESFFNFFTPPKPPATDADDEDEDEDDFYEQEMETDIEAGQAIMEEVVPKAAFYYTGKSVEEVARMLSQRFGFNFGADEDDDEEEEEEEEEEDNGAGEAFRNIVNQRGGRGRGAGPGNRGGAAPQQECKQQ